tara:strand:- start:267 stop:734 length:468 start_codon:yes stop_codon:yes gene_type:complete
MTTNEKTIEQFYIAIATTDSKKISELYAPTIRFRDPAFGLLLGNDVTKMWKMLFVNSKGKLNIVYSDIKADDYVGSARWVATYTFSKTGRKVVNEIHSQFQFKDGLIIKQTDSFDIWKWSKQAFGFRGFLFGWTGYMQKKIQEKAVASLKSYRDN